MKKVICTLLILLCAAPLADAMTFTWQQDFGGATLSDAAFVRAVTSDSSGNVIITGEFEVAASVIASELAPQTMMSSVAATVMLVVGF